MVPLLVYLGVFCFLFAADQKDYGMLLKQRILKDAASIAHIERLLREAHLHVVEGGVLVVTSAAALVSTLRAEYATKRMAQSMNAVTAVFGAFLLYLSVLTTQSHTSGSWAAIIVAVAGAVTVLLSLLAYVGLSRNSVPLLLLHAFLL
eukprot:jgi/Mesen1/10819/ME000093S10329